MDIARLGFSADTKPLQGAVDDLRAIPPAAKNAEDAAEKLEKTMKRVSGGVAEGYDLITGKMNKDFLAINKNVAAWGNLGDASVKSMKFTAREGLAFSRQMSDIGVTAFMGMNPFMIALQQGPQLFDILQEKAIMTGTSVRAVFVSLGAVIWTALAPILPIILAIAAAAGTVYAALSVGAREANAQGGDLLKTMNLTEEQLERVKKKGVETAVTVGDVWNAFFDVIGERLTKAFDGPLSWLRETWTKTLDFITKATYESVRWLVGSFGGAINSIGIIWKNLGSSIRYFLISELNQAAEDLEKLINKIIGAVNSVADIMGFNKNNRLTNISIGRIDIDPEARNAGEQVGKAYAEGFAKYAAGVDSIAADTLKRARELAVARIAGVAGKGDEPDKAKKAKDEIDKVAKALSEISARMDKDLRKLMLDQLAFVDNILTASDKYMAKTYDDVTKTIDSIKAEMDLVGKSTEEIVRATTMQQLFNDAKEKGIVLSERERKAMEEWGDQISKYKIKLMELTDTYNFSKQVFKGFFTDMRQGLEQGMTIWQAFGNAVLNALNRIIEKLLDSALNSLFDSIFGSIVGNAKGNAFGSGGIIPFAKGGIVNGPKLFPFADGIGLMGEAGPEAIMPLKRGPDGALGVQMHSGGGQGGSGAQRVAVDLYVYGEEGETFKPRVEAIARDQSVTVVKQGLREYDEALPERFGQIKNDERLR